MIGDIAVLDLASGTLTDRPRETPTLAATSARRSRPRVTTHCACVFIIVLPLMPDRRSTPTYTA